MFGIDYTKKECGPATSGERTGYVLFSLLISFFFILEIFDNYEPKRLSAVAFLLAWMPLTFLHEFGHAVLARLVGWEVKEFVVGFGRIVKEFHFRGTKVEFRMVPISGYMLPGYTLESWGRLKSALVYFGGPGIELLVFFAINSIIGFDTFLNASEDLVEILMQGIALSALTSAVINLIPMSAITDEGETPNDGLGILLSLFGRSG